MKVFDEGLFRPHFLGNFPEAITANAHYFSDQRNPRINLVDQFKAFVKTEMRKAQAFMHIECMKTNSHPIYVRMRHDLIAISVDALMEVVLHISKVESASL